MTAVKRAAPKGVDCYFDNVGGNVTSGVLLNMNVHGRISVCGSISGYNNKDTALYPAIQPFMVSYQLKMEGFLVWRWLHLGRWDEGLNQMCKWVQENKIIHRETIVEGFENLPTAFIMMLEGQNSGKMIVSANR